MNPPETTPPLPDHDSGSLRDMPAGAPQISESLSAELLRYLDDESAFFNQFQKTGTDLLAQRVGDAVAADLWRQLRDLEVQLASRRADRNRIRRLLADEIECDTDELRFSQLTPSTTTLRQVHARRADVLQQALNADALLKLLVPLMSERNVVLTSVLQSVAGFQIGNGQYDANGQLESQMTPRAGPRHF